jgi:NADPH:quinone reductase-like Zn-dependent oxidoreductase
MKAIIYTKYGPPEVAKLVEVEIPIPKENEVLIRVYASTVNRTDRGIRSAEYFISRFFSGLLKPKNQILGCEFAGQVETVGKNVSSFVVGDKVFGFNGSKFGAHAEYMTVLEDSAISTIPEDMSYMDAAPICEGGHYALSNIRAAKVKSGQRVLVNGTTGAIGSAAVQLLKHFGAHVTAVCDTPNLTLVKSLGADVLIDYLKEDFTKVEQTFDFIFDAVGKSSFGKCKPLLKKDGIYISTELGKHSANVFLALITPIFGGKKVLFPIPFIKKEDVVFLKTLVEQKEFKPVMDRQYPLEEIVEAYRYVEKGHKIGNVIISIV